MNKEIKKEWVKALRSGNYNQGQQYLRVNNGEKDLYCCLGVLCDIYTKKTGIDWKPLRIEHGEETIPKTIFAWAGLEDSNPNVTYNEYKETRACTLSELNDEAELNFNQIADLIDTQL
jgi:hypothetical protein